MTLFSVPDRRGVEQPDSVEQRSDSESQAPTHVRSEDGRVEEDQSGDSLRTFRCSSYLRSYPPTHRFAANHQAIPFQLFILLRGFNHSAIAGFKFRFWVRHPAALLHVDKIESHRVETTVGEAAGE